MKKIFKSILLLAGILIVSCAKDDSTTGSLAISAKATTTTTIANTANKNSTINKSNAQIVINNFLLNIKEFELEVDVDEQDDDNEQWDDDNFYNYDDDLELEGPFELDLMLGQISFLSVDMPNGVFEEIEFKFDKSTDATSELFEKSVLIKGTIDGTPFVFWHDFKDKVEIDFEDPQYDIMIQNNANSIVIDFDLSLLFDSVRGIDLSQATDDNSDGIIEISPYDNDGNNKLADQLKDKLKMIIDLLDD